MEYLIALLIVALIAVLFFKQPNKVYDVVMTSLIDEVRAKEADIVHGLYNKLPDNIKSKVDSQTVAQIVSFTIQVASDILVDKEKAPS
ncbi:hypothetical protein [Paenibacillus agilis]|uniref:Uncharacterized protein n=1 Tax=Paenibacillus agilis TaxID=3020863 RepID=A0A559IEN0_9BACL|nr:hypothetical protein [Paenibacillus agilis]TVX86106.1 hypothetical protein FPZ44_24530 [Paenibacillus agilis]